MALAARIAIVLVGLIHAYILVLEMFLWQTDRALAAFDMTAEYAASTARFAANQGLYNGFLAAGLLWGAFHKNPAFALQIRLFFLGCVAVAGVYGAATVKMSILYIQTVPAAVGIALTVLAARKAR